MALQGQLRKSICLCKNLAEARSANLRPLCPPLALCRWHSFRHIAQTAPGLHFARLFRIPVITLQGNRALHRSGACCRVCTHPQRGSRARMQPTRGKHFLCTSNAVPERRTSARRRSCADALTGRRGHSEGSPHRRELPSTRLACRRRQWQLCRRLRWCSAPRTCSWVVRASIKDQRVSLKGWIWWYPAE